MRTKITEFTRATRLDIWCIDVWFMDVWFIDVSCIDVWYRDKGANNMLCKTTELCLCCKRGGMYGWIARHGTSRGMPFVMPHSCET